MDMLEIAMSVTWFLWKATKVLVWWAFAIGGVFWGIGRWFAQGLIVLYMALGLLPCPDITW